MFKRAFGHKMKYIYIYIEEYVYIFRDFCITQLQGYLYNINILIDLNCRSLYIYSLH